MPKNYPPKALARILREDSINKQATSNCESDSNAQKIESIIIDRAEAEAQARVRAKAEADARARSEAQARARAEADARARSEAQARARAEADAKARAEAQARIDARAKSEAQAKSDKTASTSNIVIEGSKASNLATKIVNNEVNKLEKQINNKK